MSKKTSQPLILSPTGPFGLSLTFRILPESPPEKSLRKLVRNFDPFTGVLGLGEPLVSALSKTVPGLRTFPALSGPSCSVPSTQGALWIFLQGQGRTEIFDHSRALSAILGEAFLLEDSMETFTYAGGRDLTGYVDGTENPDESRSPGVALADRGKGLSGSSFVAVQRWVHDLDHFQSHSRSQRDRIIGRNQKTNEELEDAPPSAHIRRSAQEDFHPAAFMVRRSMPWARGGEQGLEFIAYGRSPDPFERVLRRMTGLDDGIVDALFTFSRPVRGGYYWCPPVSGSRIDLTRLFTD